MYTNPKLERVTGTAQECLNKPMPTNKAPDKQKEKQAGQKPNMNSQASQMTKGGMVTKRV